MHDEANFGINAIVLTKSCLKHDTVSSQALGAEAGDFAEVSNAQCSTAQRSALLVGPLRGPVVLTSQDERASDRPHLLEVGPRHHRLQSSKQDP